MAGRRLATALADVQAMVAALTGYYARLVDEPREVYRIGLSSVPFLLAVGDLLIGLAAALARGGRACRP